MLRVCRLKEECRAGAAGCRLAQVVIQSPERFTDHPRSRIRLADRRRFRTRLRVSVAARWNGGRGTISGERAYEDDEVLGK